ncbi:hypothetical protein KGQ64_07300, partial [bacterium]|nr:hypothetical protein [bacterium]
KEHARERQEGTHGASDGSRATATVGEAVATTSRSRAVACSNFPSGLIADPHEDLSARLYGAHEAPGKGVSEREESTRGVPRFLDGAGRWTLPVLTGSEVSERLVWSLLVVPTLHPAITRKA